jgi:Tfp pilus assembly protein FimT
LREARSRAISDNLEHEVSFDLPGNSCSVRRGDRSNGTPSFASSPGSWTQVGAFALPQGVRIKGNLACNVSTNTNFTIQFNPDGTGNNRYLCIEDNSGTRRFASGVSSSVTGRVRIRRWDTSAANWEP